MFKNDTMTAYVADRHPEFAPRAPRRPQWTAADVARDARLRAVDSLSRPVAPVFNITGLRLASTAPVPA